ncbi:pyridoxal phosphate-dependent transferase [Suillus lakei]|nr:pyridoxal phosphate-dependent transferase [Suillus lakei]
MATSADSLVAFGQQHVTRGLGRLTEAVMAKGEGSYVTFEDGRRMLDFSCGIGVTNLGHCHPKVSKAAADQCMNIVHAQCSISFHGSEAIEASLKMARQITGRQNIIAMQGGYHGRTFGAMAVTKSKTVYSEGSFPLMPGVFAIPFPYWHQLGLPINTSEEELVRLSLYQLDLVLKQQTAPRDTAAIIIEPVLGEGGYVPAPVSFLKGLRAVCDKHGILLIVDEVQSGFGRTGKYFNVEYSGVRPDILTIAKGLANGFPLSGVVSRKELTDKLVPGSMGGTYAGNAVSCAAAVAVANAFREEKVLDNVSARASELFTSLKSLRDDPEVGSMVVDIRGQGLMIAVEFASPSYSSTDPAVDRCMEKGLLILTTSLYEVIRFIPPLNISQGDLQKGCQIFVESVKEVVREG